MSTNCLLEVGICLDKAMKALGYEMPPFEDGELFYYLFEEDCSLNEQPPFEMMEKFKDDPEKLLNLMRYMIQSPVYMN